MSCSLNISNPVVTLKLSRKYANLNAHVFISKVLKIDTTMRDKAIFTFTGFIKDTDTDLTSFWVTGIFLEFNGALDAAVFPLKIFLSRVRKIFFLLKNNKFNSKQTISMFLFTLAKH